MEHFAGTIALIGMVIVVASLLSGLLERTRLPIVAVFLLLGVLLGPIGLGLVEIGLHDAVLNVLATLALAMVLFSDATTIEKRDLKTHSRLAWALLGPGTLLPAALHTAAAHWLLGLPWLPSVILGAALASTDPVLLRGAVRSHALPPVPRMALRLETGMNDVLLLPLVVIAIAMMRSGLEDTGQMISRSLVGQFLLGPLTGVLTGYLGILLMVRVRNQFGLRRDYESLYAIGLAFTAYAVAESLGGSGFLAAFAAGLMVSLQDVELCDCFREYGDATAEMLLLLTFVALGTSAIWAGLSVISGRTLLFAVIALGARTAVLYPVLSKAGVTGRDRMLVALLGPRGLGSLLLTLLAVFAGVAGADQLFAIAALVVLLSLVLHGVGIAVMLQAHHRRSGPLAPPRSVSIHTSEEMAVAPAADVAERITIGELKELRQRGEDIVVVDVRAARSYAESDLQAKGAVRLDPDDPVRDARAQRLSQRATLVVYCA